jgi:flagellar basal body-associated protein FliL
MTPSFFPGPVMASQKAVKVFIIIAAVTVMVSVAGYVVVFLKTLSSH